MAPRAAFFLANTAVYRLPPSHAPKRVVIAKALMPSATPFARSPLFPPRPRCARQIFFAEHAEAGWPDLSRSLSVAGRGGGGGLAALVEAHSRYISRMRRCMFLGADRHGALARARVAEFYEVVCAVGRVTDALLSSKSCSPLSASSTQQQLGDGAEEMVLPDKAFAELAAARENFDAARRGLCGALAEICADGGGARARPLLATIGYGGYGRQDVA